MSMTLAAEAHDRNSKSEVLKILIFARQRLTVYLLSEFLKAMGLSEVGWMTGIATKSARVEGYQQHVEQSLEAFRLGHTKLQILCATAVIEEGIDVPACNVVIRYDAPQSTRDNIQARGRARARRGAFYYVMLQRGTDENYRFALLEKQERIINNYIRERFGHSGRENGRRDTNEKERERWKFDERLSIHIESTGAYVSTDRSTEEAMRAVQKLFSADKFEKLDVDYSQLIQIGEPVDTLDPGYVIVEAKVIVPIKGYSPVPMLIKFKMIAPRLSRVELSKQVHLKLLEVLREKNIIDDHLLAPEIDRTAFKFKKVKELLAAETGEMFARKLPLCLAIATDPTDSPVGSRLCDGQCGVTNDSTDSSNKQMPSNEREASE
eukprot:GHVN01048946.1.p1 GENE.GHVN01048946.1~~GHVN01048946.1.p1  ORF type:complete len:401 (-),score=68.65 GHVN01048946.1:241-1377(-)